MYLLTATCQLMTGMVAGQTSRYKSLLQTRAWDGEAYEYVIIDNPPDLGINVINALMVTDDVVVPTKIDQWALEGLDIIGDQIAGIRSVNPRIRLAEALLSLIHI